MKKMFFLAACAALPLFAVPFEPQMDLENYALKGNFFQYNQSGDLGEPGRKAPGYWMEAWHIAKTSLLRKEVIAPVTFREADGNQCIMIPGDPRLREYNFKVTLPFAGMRFPKAGEVVCSFRMKIAPDTTGKYNPVSTILLDFRSINTNRQYGSVKERFPVLTGGSYSPTKEWKTYSFRVKVPAGNLPYSIMFRSTLNSPDRTFNTLLFDDFRIGYADDKTAVHEEALIIHPDVNSIYYEGTMVTPKIRALLRSDAAQEKVELVCRTRFDHKIMKRLQVPLKKAGYRTADGRTLYTGDVSFPMPRFGSYELLLLRGKDVMPCDVADFQMIRRPNADLSPLQRRLGIHFDGFYVPYQLSFDNKTISTRSRASNEDFMRLSRDAGFGHLILWAGFPEIMRESPEKADVSLYRSVIDQMKKYNLEPLVMIGASLNHQVTRKSGGRTYSSLPAWLTTEKYRSPYSKRHIPHLREYEILTAALIKELGKDVRYWELMGEPQWFIKPQEYFPVMQQTYRQLKAANPDNKLIAADATSDHGYNLTGWIKSLHDLGVEQYCDYVSFNPYSSALDFMNGVRFRNSDLVKRIRKIVKPGTKLWEGELYYVPNSKRAQTETNQSFFAGADGQRHMLLGLRNDLGGITSFNCSSFMRGTYAGSEMVSAMSALSYFLRGKDRTEVPDVKNSLIRQVIFRGKDDRNCSGALWVLQTIPAKMILPKLPSSIRFYDTYGNPLKSDKTMTIGLDPIFFTGTYSDLKTMFKTAFWDLGSSVKLYRRACGKENFYEAENVSGQKESIAIFPTGRKEGIRFNFNNTDHVRFRETEAPIANFSTSLNKNTEKTIDVPASPVYAIPADGELKLKTKNNVPFTLAAGQNGSLIITCEIPDTDVICGKHFFDGDAFEVFIDRTPFRHIGANMIRNTQKDLFVKQFAFDPNGRIYGGNLLTGVQEPGRTSVKVTKRAGSWKCVVTLPNEEVRPLEGNILGFSLQISRKDTGKKLEPDIFTGTESYRKRQHYALIRLPESIAGNVKLDKTASVRVSLPEEPKWGPTLRRGSFSTLVSKRQLQPGKYLLRFTVRGSKIDTFKVALAGARQLVFRNSSLPKPDSWTCFALLYEVGKTQKWAWANFEFLAARPDKDAWGEIRNVELIKQN